VSRLVGSEMCIRDRSHPASVLLNSIVAVLYLDLK
jgi:hypothetical protein